MSSDMSQTRAFSGSGRTSSSRARQNVQLTPQQHLAQIEKSVTNLLIATKQLLETLTMWSRGAATENEVSDIYVRLGYEFNIATRYFNNAGVETDDLGDVPQELRKILEDTLSQEASQASLDNFLPLIRDIIVNLLHGLKKKQARLRQKTAQSSSSSSSLPRESSQNMRQTSVASTSSNDTTITQTLEDASRRQQHYLQRSSGSDLGGNDVPPRTTSVNRQSPRREAYNASTTSHRPHGSSEDTYTSIDSSLSNDTAQPPAVQLPYPAEPVELSAEPRSPPTKQLPMQRDALAALQRGGDLERRASRRFSAYQISKHLGTSNSLTNMIPAAQHSPIPNRGREARESINAVRNRSGMAIRSKSTHKAEPEASPIRKGRDPVPVAEEGRDRTQLDVPPTTRTRVTSSERKQLDFTFPSAAGTEAGSLTNGTSSGSPTTRIPDQEIGVAVTSATPPQPIQTNIATNPQFIPEASPQPGKELTLFLQYKTKVKKFVLADGADLTIPRLQLAFIEKFAWNTHNNGVDLPEIYMQDPISGVRHELEDLSDIKDRAVLVLNVEVLDEVKRHFDDGMDGLKRMIEGIRTTVDGQQAVLQRVTDRQQDAAKEIASLAAAPARPLPTPPTASKMSSKDSLQQLDELQALRRDLAVVRQTYTSFKSDMDASIADVRAKAAAVKTASKAVHIPSVSATGGRAYVNNGKKSLQEDSEKIVTAVDDLQDTVEDLRKDVVTRGVRPLARQLESVSKEISTATSQLKKLQDFLKREKPIWTKIWEKELQVVCDDREILTMQEELCIDLEDDLEKAAATFALVEQATRQQNLDNPKQSGRSTSRTLTPRSLDPGADPLKAKDGVLGEVKALRPNHETRLEAIERAEKARQRELEDRKDDEFTKELGSFVEEGKLKKSGGVEEVERLRKLKDERAIRGYYERIAQRNGGDLLPAAAAEPAETTETPGEETKAEQAAQAEPESEPEAVTEPKVGVSEAEAALEVPNAHEDGPSPDPAAYVEASEHPLSES